jgi:hypothetical protein
MRAVSALLLVAILMLSGCAARRVAVSDPAKLSHLNSQLEGKRAAISLRDGRTSEVLDVELGTEESSWTNLWSGERVSVPAEDVRSVRARATQGRGLLKLAAYTGAVWYGIAQHMPLAIGVLAIGPPLWILFGPPTTFSDINLYELNYAAPSVPDDIPGSAGD